MNINNFLGWEVITPTSIQQVMQYSKHGGWCTKNYCDAASYMMWGHLRFLRKPGSRRFRPSYLLFAPSEINVGLWEFKAKGNKHVDPLDFCLHKPWLWDFIDAFLPESAFASKTRTAPQMTTHIQYIPYENRIVVTTVDGTVRSIDIPEMPHAYLTQQRDGSFLYHNENGDRLHIPQPQAW